MDNAVFLNIIPDVLTPDTNEQWDDLQHWGISLATTMDASTAEVVHWSGSELENHLVDYLISRDLVISYNFACFDYDILSSYGDVHQVVGFSLMDLVAETLGYRVRLQNLGRANGMPDATKLSLNQIMRSSTGEWLNYNINKCSTMRHVVERALERQTLWHTQPKTFDQLRFSTQHWSTVLEHARRRF